jgi:TolB-like protein/Tfp pilus assembly protein PilF
MRAEARPTGAAELRIGGWRVRPALNEIGDVATCRRLEPQLMDLLVFLAGSGGRVVSKDDIIDAVWNGRFIAETTLTRSIADLRRALGDTEPRRRYIETIAKRGYRLIAPVSGAGEQPAVRPTADPEADAGGGPSLVVLPFSNLGPPRDAYFCEGLTEEIINVLTRIPGLRVISRTSAFAAHRDGGDVAVIGRRLGVTHVLEGSSRRARGRVRVTAQLVRVRDHGHLWSDRYDRPAADVFRVQDEIAEAIARRLELTLTDRARARSAPTSSPEAYSRYLEGRHHFQKGTRESLERAEACLGEAVRLDPSFALAHDALSEVFWYQGFYGLKVPKDAFTQALWESLRALEIDDRLGEAHALLAMLRKELDYDWAEVEREFATARALAPFSPLVRLRHAICGLMPHGRTAEAAAELERVAQADPLSPVVLWWLSVMYWFAGELDSMQERIARMHELDASHPLAQMALGCLRLSGGQPSEAVAPFQKAVELAGRPPWLMGWLGLACGLAGQEASARRLREELVERSPARDVAPTSLALVALGLGDRDEAFRWLDRAVEVRDPHVVPLRCYPPLAALRADPRYGSLLAKLRLAPGTASG